MKIRQGFVSNSSSSSFMCNVCYDIYEGWDGEYDCIKFTCQNNHEICEGCLDSINMMVEDLAEDMHKAAMVLDLSEKDYKDLIESDNKKEFIREIAANKRKLHPALCPVCNLTHISAEMEADFLCEMHGLKHEDVFNEIRKIYKNLEEWRKRK